jgi:hypothetical protein
MAWASQRLRRWISSGCRQDVGATRDRPPVRSRPGKAPEPPSLNVVSGPTRCSSDARRARRRHRAHSLSGRTSGVAG